MLTRLMVMSVVFLELILSSFPATVTTGDAIQRNRRPGQEDDDAPSLLFSSDSKHLMSVKRTLSAAVWNVEKGELKSSVECKGEFSLVIAISGDGHSFASHGDEGFAIYDIQKGTITRSVKRGENKFISSLAMDVGGKLLAAGGPRGQTFLYDTVNPNPPTLLTREDQELGTIMALAFSNDGKLLVGGGADDSVSVWDVRNKKRTHLLVDGKTTDKVKGVHAVTFSLDNLLIAAGFNNGTACIWAGDSGKLVSTVVPASTVDALAISPDGKILATGGIDCSVTLWDINTKAMSQTLAGEPKDPKPISSVTFSPDGKLLAIGRWDGTITLWDVKARKIAWSKKW